jgi:sigma-B regulation protein RsbU (phosphoserine phosphatase)
MSKKAPEELQQRIEELEIELAARESDLALFRNELSKANLQLKKLIDQISSELKTASKIQKALVPTEFPTIPGFEFSTKFVASPISGGDYFDIFEHEDKFRFGVVLANSSGYSMSALFLSVLLKMSGQLEARKGTPPNEILEMMGKELVPNVEGNDIANVFYAVVDRRSFELTYAHAGNYIGLLVSEHKVNKLEVSNAPIGKNFQSGIENKVISLNPHDKLVLCSEGILKVLNSKNEKFGEERLFKAVLAASEAQVHDLRNELMIQVEKFSGGREIPQDITVLVLEVKDRVIKLAKSRK